MSRITINIWWMINLPAYRMTVRSVKIHIIKHMIKAIKKIRPCNSIVLDHTGNWHCTPLYLHLYSHNADGSGVVDERGWCHF